MTSSDPEHALLQRARSGDRSAQDDLLREHLPRLRVFIRAHSDRKLRLRESNSDLVQSVCREVLQHLDQYEWRGQGTFRFWLFTLALNKLRNKEQFHRADIRDVARESARNVDSAQRAEELARAYLTITTPTQHAIAHELTHNLEEALDRLPEHYRDVILLARVVGLPHNEIATQLGKSEVAVRQLLARALAHLASDLEQVERESTPFEQ